MKLSEGTVYGEQYYTVDPNFNWDTGWYNQHWNDMLTWTVNIFGPTPKDGIWTPNARWYANNSKFWFKDKKDLEWFIIRWA